MGAVNGTVASEEECRLWAKDGRAEVAAENSTDGVTGAREE